MSGTYGKIPMDSNKSDAPRLTTQSAALDQRVRRNVLKV
jgi:hypothetical protein